MAPTCVGAQVTASALPPSARARSACPSATIISSSRCCSPASRGQLVAAASELPASPCSPSMRADRPRHRPRRRRARDAARRLRRDAAREPPLSSRSVPPAVGVPCRRARATAARIPRAASPAATARRGSCRPARRGSSAFGPITAMLPSVRRQRQRAAAVLEQHDRLARRRRAPARGARCVLVRAIGVGAHGTDAGGSNMPRRRRARKSRRRHTSTSASAEQALRHRRRNVLVGAAAVEVAARPSRQRRRLLPRLRHLVALVKVRMRQQSLTT